MIRAIVYSVWLLLLITNCARQKQPNACENLDSATGQCVSADKTVADPDDSAAFLERSLKNNQTLQERIRQLEDQKAELEARNASPQEVGAITNQIAALSKGLLDSLGNNTVGVDTSKLPTVMLKFRRAQNKQQTPTFVFSHVEAVQLCTLTYGEDKSLVFNTGGFTTKKMQLSEVTIPVKLRFKFGGTQYCASTSLSYSFESGQQQMEVNQRDCQ